MTKEKNIARIREKCIKANPSVASCNVKGCDGHHTAFHLADVLLALGVANVPGVYIDRYGHIEGRGAYQNTAKWNLRADNLTLQSDETIQFLADLLNQ